MTFDLRRLQSPGYRRMLNACSHCGLCLEACPTYAVLHAETDSPRGRIALIRAAAAGRMTEDGLAGALSRHIDLCLTCRACETACPSGVQYAALLHEMRGVLAAGRRPGAGARLARWLGLRQLLPHRGRLAALARLLWLYELSGLQRLVRSRAVQRLLPARLAAAEAILPVIAPATRAYRGPAPALGPRHGRVAFFYGCIQDALLADANAATVRVLQRNGYEVHFPAGQTCCGAAHLHTGDEVFARDLARRNVDALLAEHYDAIISNAGGCGATLKVEYPGLLADDPAYAGRARELAGRMQDFGEFLAAHLHVPLAGWPAGPLAGPLPVRAVYADSCHLRHVQGVTAAPRELLRRVPGLELTELRHPERCCGSAGVYNLAHPELADEILDQKLAEIAEAGALLVVTANTGCHLQLQAGLRRAGRPVRVLHLAQVLDLAYGDTPLPAEHA